MSTYSITSSYPFRRHKVEGFFVEEHPDLGEIQRVILTPDQRFTPVCHECGTKAQTIHSHETRELRDLSVSGKPCLITYHYRKIECPDCKAIKVEKSQVTDPGGVATTKRYARMIHGLCKDMTVRRVAEIFKLDWTTVKKIHERWLEKEFGADNFFHSGYLAVDEFTFGKYHKYLTVVIDFNTGRVMWVGKKRKADTLRKFFSKMSKEQRAKIKAVAMDMWKPYIKVVKEFCPEADIVFDKYHIIASYHRDVIDEIRRSELRKISKDHPDYDIYKGTKYYLFKNPENLNQEEKEQLDQLLELNKNISRAYILKDQLKRLFQQKSSVDMHKDLVFLIKRMEATELKSLKKFASKLRSHWPGIISYASHRIHTSLLEGINNKIKEIKRSAFGFHDFNYFKLKIKCAFPGNLA